MILRSLRKCCDSILIPWNVRLLILICICFFNVSHGQNKKNGNNQDVKPANPKQLLFPDYNTVLYSSRPVIIYSSDPSETEDSKKAAEAFRSSKNLYGDFMPDTLALRSNLIGANLYVFGTKANAWINTYYQLIPVSVTTNKVTAGKTHTGNDYCVITLAPNPIDSSRVLLLFIAQKSEGLKNINALFDKNESISQYSIFKADSLVEDGFVAYNGKKALFLNRNPLTDRLFTVTELKEDVAHLIKSLESIHPNLYAYRAKTEFINDLSIAIKKINRPMTRKEFGHIMIPVVNTLKHGHTNLNLPWADMDAYRKGGGTFIPFNTHINNNKLFVANSLNKEIPPNAQVLSINGLSAQKILSKLRSYSNGEKDDYKHQVIESYFPRLVWHLFKGSGVPFEIALIDSTGNQRKVKTAGLKLSEISFTKKLVQYNNPFEMHYINDSIAHLKYNLCTNYDEFKVFLNEHFKIIREKGIRNLIVDIRDNPGGNSGVNTLIFNYLTNKPYNNGEDKPTIPDSVRYPFNGKAYLLTSNKTFSSANMCASTFKCNKFGKVIGEETGGLTVSYGQTYPVFLPNTKLIAGIATTKFVEACGVENGRGLIPDVIVEDNRSNGSDKILATCIQLINGK